MCFSAEASFVGAGVIGALGLAGMKLPLPKRYFWVAAIPVLFALQQFAEGIVWLTMTHRVQSDLIASHVPYLYLFFAFLVWPFWIPFSLSMAETDPFRKKILLTLLGIGTLLSCYYLSYFPTLDLKIAVVGHGLNYTSQNMNAYVYLYLLSVIVPFFVSSIPKIWMFGAVVAISYVLSALYFHYALTSVWCFFSALCSGFLYFLLRYNESLVGEKPLR